MKIIALIASFLSGCTIVGAGTGLMVADVQGQSGDKIARDAAIGAVVGALIDLEALKLYGEAMAHLAP